MKTINIFVILLKICVIVFFISCNHDLVNFVDEPLSAEKEAQLNDTIDDYKHKLVVMGFDTTSVYEWDDYYVVEGDILISKKMVDPLLLTTRQYRTNYYVSNGEKYTIGVDNTIQINTEWREAVEEVISIYNANTGFRLVYTENNPDIRITKVNSLESNVCAQGTFPSIAGKPGNNVYINYAFQYNIDNFLSLSQKVFLLMHEVGHNLGFRHTDGGSEGEGQFGLINIPGTPTHDPNSFMNSGTCGLFWNGFSGGDIIALNYLWPYRCFVSGANGEIIKVVMPNTSLDRSVVPDYDMGIFSGWYKDVNLSTPWNYDNDIINSDIILYPKWRHQGGVGRIETTSHATSSISFTVSETTGVTLTAKVERGLNEWWEISPYPNGTYVIVGRTSSIMKRIDMAQYIWHMNPETYIERTENIVLDAGTHWLYAAFPLANQDGASGKHGITYAIINQ